MSAHRFTADPRKIIPDFEFGDKVFRCSQVTAANLLDLQAKLSSGHPGARIHVMQSCYNTGVALSAGTHDKDAVLDISASGISWPDLQNFCRRHGWAAWWRHTGAWASPGMWHIHMVSLAAYKAVGNANVGIWIPGQVSDYYGHRNGLADHSGDSSWHPANIDATVLDYRAWFKQWEDNMAYKDWPAADKQALVSDVVNGILNAKVGPADDLTLVRTALYRASNVPDLIRTKTRTGIAAVVAKLTTKS